MFNWIKCLFRGHVWDRSSALFPLPPHDFWTCDRCGVYSEIDPE